MVLLIGSIEKMSVHNVTFGEIFDKRTESNKHHFGDLTIIGLIIIRELFIFVHFWIDDDVTSCKYPSCKYGQAIINGVKQ